VDFIEPVLEKAATILKPFVRILPKNVPAKKK